MKKFYLIIALFVLLGCKEKAVPVTQESLQTVLTKFGSENPENRVTIKTSFGTIKLRLYEDTPLHRANFVKLIKEGHYENADFYRIVSEFMIQGGDLTNKLNYRIPAEFNSKYFHKKGALSMARTDENNPKFQSSAAEFFIVHGQRYADWDIDGEARNNGLTLMPEQRAAYLKDGGYMSLDTRYTVFGEVVEGLEVVDKIASQKIYNEDKPVQKIPFEISVSKE
ncbi:peptidylprolyl isomerase [Pseudochryseolinea flava]|uniref:Peptidyl-prolyl cis-trans isomerase n=1 Tax=Pseudochryseolinea flava TaxID=2059302 RepID=A0A364Y2W6_9BACT|nr:peptidylprolyl isomerase [Pseudochryseolinea flava]RAW00447.1 peptidylprolyl isomerase [Pseudochryseolinea flava]